MINRSATDYMTLSITTTSDTYTGQKHQKNDYIEQENWIGSYT